MQRGSSPAVSCAPLSWHAVRHATARVRQAAALGLLLACAAIAQADDLGDARLLLQGGKPAEALAKVDQALAARPKDPGLQLLRGVILAEQDRVPDALAQFTALAQDHPELPEPYNNMAVLHARQGQYDKARIALEMAIRNNPDRAEAHENLGDVHAHLAARAYMRAQQLGSRGLEPKLRLVRELLSGRPAASAR